MAETMVVKIEPKALKVKDAAKVMQTSERVLRNLIRAGFIRAMKLPTMTISIKEIERAMDYITEKQIDLTELGEDDFAKRYEESNVVSMSMREAQA